MAQEEQTVEVRGTRLAYRDSGAPPTSGRHSHPAPTFIWAHSLLASMAQEDATGIFDWSTLAGQARIIRYDARGHGNSAVSRDPRRQTWPELGADLLALLDKLGVGTAVGGGASMGCGTLLHAACQAPARFDALVLALPPTAWGGRRLQAVMYRTVGITAANPIVDVAVSAFSAVRARLPTRPRTPRRALVSAGMDQFLRSPHTTVAPFNGAAATNLPAPSELQKLEMPVLILAWTGDRMHPMTVAQRLHELLPQSELVVAADDDEVLQWPKHVAEFLAARPAR